MNSPALQFINYLGTNPDAMEKVLPMPEVELIAFAKEQGIELGPDDIAEIASSFEGMAQYLSDEATGAVAQFMQHIAKDASALKKIRTMGPAEFCEYASSLGYTLTDADFSQFATQLGVESQPRKLDDAELENVAGGFLTGCLVIGSLASLATTVVIAVAAVGIATAGAIITKEINRKK